MSMFRSLTLAATSALALSLAAPAVMAQAPAVETAAIPFEQWEIGRAQIGEVSIVYRKAGNGPPLVLLHGWPQHSLMWHTIGPILAHRDCSRSARRGHVHHHAGRIRQDHHGRRPEGTDRPPGL
jgi:hypothetical protein